MLMKEDFRTVNLWEANEGGRFLKTVLWCITNSLNVACLLCGVILFVSLSCSRSKPEINYGFIQLVQYEGETRPLERFSFFILAEDEDGIENLEELYLYHDREQLRWHISSDDWVSFTRDGSTWIGTRSIAFQDNESLPRGQYRAVLVTKGGESSERTFSFDSEVRYPFPSLEISEGRYTVSSEWPKNRLVGYDSEGNYAATVEIQELSGSVADLRFSSRVRTAALWADDPDRMVSAFTNIVSVR